MYNMPMWVEPNRCGNFFIKIKIGLFNRIKFESELIQSNIIGNILLCANLMKCMLNVHHHHSPICTTYSYMVNGNHQSTTQMNTFFLIIHYLFIVLCTSNIKWDRLLTWLRFTFRLSFEKLRSLNDTMRQASSWK